MNINHGGEGMYTKLDRDSIQRIKEQLNIGYKKPRYIEKDNALIVSIEGDYDLHIFIVRCLEDVLTVVSLKSIFLGDCVSKVLKYALNMNRSIFMGGFCYESDQNHSLTLKLSIPLYEIPNDSMIFDILLYGCNLMDSHVPKILAMAKGNYVNQPENETTTH